MTLTTIRFALTGHTWEHIEEKAATVIPAGEENPNCKISEADVVKIRATYQKGKHGKGTTTLARLFGCSVSQMYNIVTRRQRA